MSEIPDGGQTDPQDYDLETFRDQLEGGVLLAYEDYSSAEGGLCDKLALLAASLQDLRKGDTIIENDDVVSVAQKFEKFSKAVLDEYGLSEEMIEYIVNAFMQDSMDRVSLFSALTECESECFFSVPRESLQDTISGIFTEAENDKEALRAIGGLYFSDLGADINTYIDHLRAMHANIYGGNSEPNATIEIKKSKKDHVIDVAKIAAGVFIALSADRIMRRRS